MTNVIALLLISSTVVAIAAAVQSNFPRPNYDNIPQCAQPKESGVCLAYIPSFYYNPSIEKCERFIYGGCQGNKNRFRSEAECMKTCGGFKLTTTKFELVTEASDNVKRSVEVDVCSLPMEVGHCYAAFPKFYFNGEKCETFTYGGCGGNENNFWSLEECEKACPPRDSAASVENNENETS